MVLTLYSMWIFSVAFIRIFFSETKPHYLVHMGVTGLYLSGDLPRISHNLLCLPRSLGVLLHYIIAITLTSELCYSFPGQYTFTFGHIHFLSWFNPTSQFKGQDALCDIMIEMWICESMFLIFLVDFLSR